MFSRCNGASRTKNKNVERSSVPFSRDDGVALFDLAPPAGHHASGRALAHPQDAQLADDFLGIRLVTAARNALDLRRALALHSDAPRRSRRRHALMPGVAFSYDEEAIARLETGRLAFVDEDDL